jgi:hypothetical protein
MDTPMARESIVVYLTPRLKEFVKRKSKERQVSQSRYVEWLVEQKEDEQVEEYPLLDRYAVPYTDADILRWRQESVNEPVFDTVEEALRSLDGHEVTN